MDFNNNISQLLRLSNYVVSGRAKLGLEPDAVLSAAHKSEDKALASNLAKFGDLTGRMASNPTKLQEKLAAFFLKHRDDILKPFTTVNDATGEIDMNDKYLTDTSKPVNFVYSESYPDISLHVTKIYLLAADSKDETVPFQFLYLLYGTFAMCLNRNTHSDVIEELDLVLTSVKEYCTLDNAQPSDDSNPFNLAGLANNLDINAISGQVSQMTGKFFGKEVPEEDVKRTMENVFKGDLVKNLMGKFQETAKDIGEGKDISQVIGGLASAVQSEISPGGTQAPRKPEPLPESPTQDKPLEITAPTPEPTPVAEPASPVADDTPDAPLS